jgi:eukaryotic-like serine/threonine-protein kinase
MGNPGESCPEPVDLFVGQKAVELGLITEMQLRDVVARLAADKPEDKDSRSLRSALVKLGLLTQRQMDALRDDTASVRKKFGKYRIVRQLGKGGMGVVYEAIDADLGRTVALKMLLNGPQNDPKEIAIEEERFVREARLSASLPKHPGIVGVFESGILEGRRYIAMEYIEGMILSEWITKNTTSLRIQVTILRDTALAVDHANRHGVVHRDLKPANVLIDTTGHPHVTDFGLAKQVNVDASLTLTGGGKVMGTPSYISPEQASGRKDVDKRTDVWALGIMLYEILTGRPPFRGETPIDIMMKAAQNPVPPPSTVVREGPHRAFDKAIESICLKALAKDPAHRYASAKAFADDLTRWIKGETVVVRTRTETSVRRAQAPIAWMVGIAAVAAVALLVFAVPRSPSPEQRAQERRDRAATWVTQGQRLIVQGKLAEALAAFDEASDLDPENRAAASGKKDAERRIAESLNRPPERVVVAPATPPAKEVVQKAVEFTRANPKDIEGQIRVWKEARAAAEGTPFAAEAAREFQAAVGRRRESVARELSEIDRFVAGLREGETFGIARDYLEDAAKRHDDPDWGDAIRSRQEDLRKAVDALFGPVKAKAIEAKRRGDRAAVDNHRTRVSKWKLPEFASDLEDAVGKTLADAPPPPPPTPLPPAEPARLTGLVELPSLHGHDSGISALALSPDARLAVSSSWDQTVRLWDVPSRSQRSKLLEATEVPSVAFSPDGKWIVAGAKDGTVRIWDTAKLQLRTLTGHTLQVRGLAFSPDSKQLASASTDGTVRFWDPLAGVQRSQLDGHPKGAMGLAWSPDGKLLAVACADHQVKIWEAAGAREKKVLSEGLEGAVLSVAFAPNGKSLVTGGEDSRVSIWDIETGRKRVLAGHTREVRVVAWSPDGQWIASAAADTTLRLWEVVSGEKRATFEDPNSFFGTVFSRKGDLLAGAAGSSTVRLWDLSAVRPSKNNPK